MWIIISWIITIHVQCIIDEDALKKSDGSWHRDQRGNLPFNNACNYYGDQGCHVNGLAMLYEKGDKTGVFAQQTLEKDTLIIFNQALDGGNWIDKFNWGPGWPCLDGWYGVVCNEKGLVVALELDNNRLKGTIPDDINNLTSLRRLNLGSAPLIHGHPNERRNILTGILPNLMSMKDLREVELSGNELEELPYIHLNKATLELLSCTRNKLKKLPQVLWGMFKLEILDLSENQMTSTIPDLFGQSMFRIWYLSLAKNQLQGEVPGTIRTMTKMRIFDISDNPGIVKYWPQGVVWKEVEYISIYGTSLTSISSSGTVSGVPNLCLDQPFCYKFMWDTHGDFTEATYKDFASNTLVQETLELAKSRGPQ